MPNDQTGGAHNADNLDQVRRNVEKYAQSQLDQNGLEAEITIGLTSIKKSDQRDKR